MAVKLLPFPPGFFHPFSELHPLHSPMIGLFVLIDALGWAYLRDRNFLPDILTYRQQVPTVLGFSSGAIPVILSGKQPRESGHWNLFFYSPEHSPFHWIRTIRFLSPAILNTRLVRRGVRYISQRLGRFDGYFQIHGVPVELLPYFDICEKKDIYRPGGVPHSIFSQMSDLGFRFRTYSYHEFSDEEAIRQASLDLKAKRFDFYFVYLAELDALLHHSCKDKTRVHTAIDRYERWMRRLYSDACEHNEPVDFCVMSDHGMTPKVEGFDLLRQIDSLPVRMPHDYIALYDSTMARFWFFNSDARECISHRLTQLDCGRILTSQEQKHYGLDFDDNRYGDLIFLMHPGVLIEPSFMGKHGPEGMHGFDPDVDPWASAIFLSNYDPGRPVRSLQDVNSVIRDWITSRQSTVNA